MEESLTKGMGKGRIFGMALCSNHLSGRLGEILEKSQFVPIFENFESEGE